MERLVRDLRDIDLALGDGVKRVYESELSSRQRLRRVLSRADGEPVFAAAS
jgi:N-acetylneuraminate synthase